MRAHILIVFCLLLSFISFGQTVEICNDGIDNDGNGLVDCADPFCNFAANIERGCNCFDNVDNDGDGAIDKADPNCASYYGLEFVGEGSSCSITPPAGSNPFAGIGPPAVSGQNTADTQSKVSVGDVDGDGIPDAVITSKWNSEIRVVATSNGQADGSDAGDIKADFKTTGQGAKIFSGSGGCNPKNLLFEHENLIADIDKDGKAEVFGIVSNRGGNPSTPPTCFFLVAFRYTPGELVPMYDAVQIGADRPGVPGIADMDGDGKAEIYLRDRIYAAETGVLLATSNGNWDLDITSGPVAVSVTGDAKMELVCGTKIFSIPNLTNRTPASPTALTLFQDMNSISADKCFVKLANDPVEYGVDTHSMCSVADIDRDGNIDVVISGALNSETGPTAVFYWNVAKSKVSFFLPPDPVYANGWPWGTGRVNLGDANGDGKTDLTFMAGSQLFCMTTDASDNIVPLWATPRTVNDSRSGVLTVSIYDFNNDGDPEMVYRDSQELVVIDGATGQTKLWSAACQSHTYTEGVVIADVNGDGATDICVPCNRNNSFDINDPIQQQALGEVRLFFTNGNEWLPTRKVWNQPGYFVVNIKDDLTLPFPQLDQNLVFSNSPCPNGTPGPQMPMNVFLNQVPFLSAEGCPVFPAPDLAFFGDDPANPGVDIDGDGVYTPAVEITPPICGNLDISAVFNIVNSGDLPITDNVPVAFFNGDPLNGGTYLHNAVLNIANLQLGQTLKTPSISFNGPGTVFTLYIVLYSDGTLPLVINNTKECSIANNTYTVLITPDPFTGSIEKVSDNFKCDNTAPDNGELRAHIFKGGVETFDYSPYSFQWYQGTDTSTPIPGPAGTDYLLTDAAEGPYTLVVTNTAKGCTSDPVTETIVRLGNDPDITINVISDQTVCSPANGQLQAVIAGGNTGFTFEWFDISLNPLGITGPNANNLSAGNYLVRVSKDGCVKISDPVTVNGPQIPDAQAVVVQNVVDCSDPNSGVIQADALFNGVVQNPADYQFDWYFYNNATSTRGSILPPANGTGQIRTGLAAGFYQAEIRQISTQCVSTISPVVEVQTQTIIPTASITQLAPQTSCDVNNPNGILTAEALVGGVPQNPADFTFEWFKGDNTLPANLHAAVSDVNGKQANSVSGGGEYYTVKVTTANNCFATEKFIIAEDVNVPVVTLSTSPNSICDPLKASSTYNGSVTATVTFDGAPVSDFSLYEFTWHDGLLTSDPVHPVADNKDPLLANLNNGDYTVTAERTDLSCTSVPVSDQVLEDKLLPVIGEVATPSTNCVPGFENGVAEVATVDGSPVGSVTIFDYQWHTGAGTASPIVSATSPVLSGLQGGPANNFTVLVTNTTSGCENTKTMLVADASAKPVVTLGITNNSVCDPALTSPATPFNGRLDVTAVTYKGAPYGGGSTLTYKWWNNNTATGVPAIISQIATSRNNLDNGDYSNTVTIDDLGCESDFVPASVIDVVDLPDVVSASTPSTNCVAGLENGVAEVVTVDGSAVGAVTNSHINGIRVQARGRQFLLVQTQVPMMRS
ncbi:MAG: FG-GAP-like repeat-containing protein [Cyclobacteriaceae bacterium]